MVKAGRTILLAQIGGVVAVGGTVVQVGEGLAPRVRCLHRQAMAELMLHRGLQTVETGDAIEARLFYSSRLVAHERHARRNVGRGVGSDRYGADKLLFRVMLPPAGTSFAVLRFWAVSSRLIPDEPA